MKLFAFLITMVISAPALAEDEYFEVTPQDEAKLEAIENQSEEAAEKAHQAAMKRAGVTDNTVDPYSVQLETLPQENKVYIRTEGTKHEDRTGAVVTGTRAFLGN